jgi:membrane protein
MVISTVISEVIRLVQGASPDIVARIVSVTLDNLMTFALGTLLFAAIFKVLPDAEMAWRDTWLGAAITALLFVVGKAIIAWYLRQASFGSSWGSAAGSVVAILAWLYYTSLIVLFGAELTQVWARRYGGGIRPENGAVRAVREKKHVREDDNEAAGERPR